MGVEGDCWPAFANLQKRQFGKGAVFKTVNQLPRSLWDNWRQYKIEGLLAEPPSAERDLGIARSLRRLSAETSRPKRLT